MTPENDAETPLHTTFYRCFDQIFFSHQTSIIMYHGFTDKIDQLENYHGKHLHIQTFRKQLQYLKKHYSMISLDQFVDHVLTNTPMAQNAVVLTFDDGYESNFVLAFPLLKEFNAPATIFLTTDFIEQKQFIWANRVEYAILAAKLPSLHLNTENKEQIFDLSHDEAKKETIFALKTLFKTLDDQVRDSLINTMEQSLGQKLTFDAATPPIHRSLNWQQIQEMSQSPLITFGAHTCSHAILARCSLELANKEIIDSKRIIEKQINKNCRLFCYPYGGKDTFNNQTKVALQQAGYSCALTTITGKNNQDSDLFSLKRVGTSNLVGLDNFEKSLLTRH